MKDATEIFIQTTLQSQYRTSPKLVALIRKLALRILPNDDVDLFYTKIFNIDTAQGYGLDVWGDILGVSRNLEIEETSFFGFGEADGEPFNQAAFNAGAVTNAYALTDRAYRDLLMLKALSNISSADAKTLNEILSTLFNDQTVYVLDNQNMSIRFIFRFFLEPWIKSIFNTPGLLTRGAGVKAEVYELPADTFGFGEAGGEPFGQGAFSMYTPKAMNG